MDDLKLQADRLTMTMTEHDEKKKKELKDPLFPATDEEDRSIRREREEALIGLRPTQDDHTTLGRTTAEEDPEIAVLRRKTEELHQRVAKVSDGLKLLLHRLDVLGIKIQ